VRAGMHAGQHCLDLPPRCRVPRGSSLVTREGRRGEANGFRRWDVNECKCKGRRSEAKAG